MPKRRNAIFLWTFEENAKFTNKVRNSILDCSKFYDWSCQALERLIHVSFTKKKLELLFLSIKNDCFQKL